MNPRLALYFTVIQLIFLSIYLIVYSVFLFNLFLFRPGAAKEPNGYLSFKGAFPGSDLLNQLMLLKRESIEL